MIHKTSLCDDGIFRGIFGQEGSETILTDLVNSVLKNAGDPTIESLTIKNPFQLQDLVLQKEPILDIKATDNTKQLFDIEIQIANHENFRERILYYWSRSYGRDLKQGESYTDLKPVVGIVFTKFPIYPENKEILYDSFYICSKNDPTRILTRHFALHFITVPDEERQYSVFQQDLQRWLKVLNYPNKTSEAEMENIATENPIVDTAFEKAKHFLADPSVQDYIEAKYKFDLDQTTRLQTSRNEGRAEGRAEGRMEGRAEGQISDILTLLNERFGPVDSVMQKTLSAKSQPDELRFLLITAATCTNLDEFKAQL